MRTAQDYANWLKDNALSIMDREAADRLIALESTLVLLWSWVEIEAQLFEAAMPDENLVNQVTSLLPEKTPTPSPEQIHRSSQFNPTQDAMNLRDFFAGQALSGLLTITGANDPNKYASASYKVADCMLKARKAKA